MKTLEDVFYNYAFDKMGENGFITIPLPTGSGKSTAIFNFIYQVIKENKHDDKIVLITSLKKNLQFDELKKVFESNNDKDLFNNKVIFLKSNIDCVLENLPDLVNQNLIPERFLNLPVFIKLWNEVKYCVKNENTNDIEIKNIVEEKKDKIRKELEPSFRKVLKRLLTEEIKETISAHTDYKIRLDYISHIEKKTWGWIISLYPQILTSQKQVYVMSMDKFLLRNDPIIDGSYFIYKKLSNKSIVFMDEFDATKTTILNRLIEDAISNNIDYVSAFKLIKNRLDQGDFPEEMLIPSKKQTESEDGVERLKKVIPGWQERANQIEEDYKTDFVFKNDQHLEEESTFLFQDASNLLVSREEDKRRIVFTTEENRKENRIYLSTEKSEEEKSLTHMIKDVRGFLRFFCGGVWILARNYKEHMDDINREYTIESSVKSILDNFFPTVKNEPSKYKDFFTNSILLYYSSKDSNKQNVMDASFFENGFTFYSIEDDDDHSLRSAIIMTELESTPEKILLDICKRNRVFGVSATANYNTLLGNYALKNYLIPKLKKDYFELNSEELDILKARFNDSISGYDKVNIKAVPIENDENYNEEAWEDLLNYEDAEEISSMIQQSVAGEEDKDNYIEKRYLRIARLFANFIDNKNIKSLLCLLTTFPSKKVQLREDILAAIFDSLGKGSFRYHENVAILRSGADYEVKKESIKEKLSEGQKLLVISTYATVGAGQNLQYKIPETEKNRVVQINEFAPSEEKDFDAIFLDKPTNLLIQPKQYMNQKELLQYLTQTESLKEAGEISYKDSNRLIKNGFKAAFYGKKAEGVTLADKVSYTSFATKVLVQAVGRISRTNMKNPEIFIYYDSDISSIINRNTCSKNLLNPEFTALINAVPEQQESNVEIKNMEELATTNSEYVLKRIQSFLVAGRNGWKKDAIEEWEFIRYFVLCHPTLSNDEYIVCDERLRPLYIELPADNDHVWYERVGDYKEIKVQFNKTEESLCVCAESARLPLILANKDILKSFEDNGLATDFKKNKYILCPPAFTNIYLGALGEYVGRMFLESKGIYLEEIKEPMLFELFDFKVKEEEKNIFIDFKHWNEFSAFLPNNEDVMDHIFDKLDRSNGDKAIIVNLFAENDFIVQNETRDGRQVVQIPNLFDVKENCVKENTRNINKIIDLVKGE